MKKFSCYLVGSDNLLIECAKLLISAGNSILGIFSRSAHVRSWSHENQINFIRTIAELETQTTSKRADYLFSIVNDQVLNEQIIYSPKYFSINYHDSLLPAYAGVHATSWALLNGEKKHGITWHIMDNGIDTGDLLIQESFEIESNETAFSLNIKCYSAALSLFPTLVGLLQNQVYNRASQNLEDRTYYGLHQKPPTLGWIDWDDSSQKIDRIVRALDFGNYENRFTSSKCILGQQLFFNGKIKTLPNRSKRSPGTILSFDEDHITLTTKTNDVILSELKSLDGTLVNFRDVLTRNNLSIDSKLPLSSFNNSKDLEKTLHNISKNEAFWVAQYLEIEETNLPFLAKVKTESPLVRLKDFKIKKSALNKLNQLEECDNNCAMITFLLLFIYLLRFNNKSSGSIFLGIEGLLNTIPELQHTLNSLAPLTMTLSSNTGFHNAWIDLQHKISQLKKHVGCFRDLHLRYPSLKNTILPTISIIIGESIEPYQNLSNLVFLISNDGEQITTFCQSSSITDYAQIVLGSIQAHLQMLLNGIIQNPKHSIFHLPIITKKEIQQLTIEWNKTSTSYPRHNNLQQLFEKQALLSKHHDAIILENSVVSYYQLNEEANRLAHYFQERGLQTGDKICIILERSVDLIVAILATIKAGGIYIPIDPDQPNNRVSSIFKDCTPKLYVSVASCHKKLTQYAQKGSIILIDQDQSIIRSQPINNPKLRVRPKNTVNIMYTSGSTGKPKGIEISHRGIIRLVKNTNFVGVKNTDCVAFIANPMFDASTFELWATLLNGARLVIIKKEIISATDLFKKELLKNKINLLLLTSALFDLIVNTTLDALEKIHTLIVVGDVLSPISVQKVLAKYPLRIINGYGPTENTGATTYYEINHFTPQKHATSIPIGKPVSNSSVYVYDQNLQLLPAGATGELLTGGDGLANGYFNNSALTQKNFIKNPCKRRCPTLYKTGDLVRWLPDGNLEYIGRIDSLVKIRGFRVELAEVEQALLAHPKIVGTMVSSYKPVANNQKIVAFIILEKRNSLDASDIKSFLSQQLPEYMIPSSYLFIDKFPLTLNSKIDKEKLFDLLLIRNTQKSETLIPVNDLQKSLSKIWSRVFKTEDISINESFFDLGGDSIIAMQIQFEARQLGIHLTVKDIFTYKNILDLTPHVNYLQDKTKKTVTQPRNKKIPLTPIQSWFFEQKFLKKEEFSQYCIIEIENNISLFLIENQIKQLIEKNDCFHLHYRYQNKAWSQYYNPGALNYALQEMDLIDFDETKRNSFFKEKAQFLQSQFNLDKGPLFATLLIRSLVDKKSYLLFAAHHLIFDGVSWRIFLTNLANTYSGYPYHHKEANGFVDWSLFLSLYGKEHVSSLQKDAYINIINKITQIKYDHETGPNSESSIETIKQTFTTTETGLIQHIANKHQVRLDELLLAICAHAVCRWQNIDGIVIDLERHGRENLDTSIDPGETLGWFTSLFPVLIECDHQNNVTQHLLQTKQQLESIQKNGIHYGILKYLSNIKTELPNNAFISFNYWGQFDSFFDKDSHFVFKDLGLISNPDNMRTHQINIEALIVNGQLTIKWIYSTNFYKKQSITNLSNNANETLRSFFLSFKNIPPKSVRQPRVTDKASTIHSRKNPFVSINNNAYPLTPIQTGLLFHTVNTPGCEAYAVQLSWALPSQCNFSILQRSFNILIQRHALLRVYFEWIGRSNPIQHIQDAATLPWHEYDWTASSIEEQKNRLCLFLKTDRQTNFSLSRAPLIRVSLIKLSAQEYQIIITMHHILLDGWSMPIFLKELGTIYDACMHSQTISLPKSASFFDYIVWLQQQHTATKKRKWKKYLRGFYSPTDLLIIKKHDKQPLIDYQEINLILNSKMNDRIKRFCQKYQVTISTIIQATWALLLSRYSGQPDVAFGLTVSVRSSDISNIDQMIGLAINTIPFRVKINEHQTTINYLKKIQENFINLLELSSSSLTDIHAWSEIEKGSHLFNTILIVENYPLDSGTILGSSLNNIKIIDPTHYPLTIVVSTTDELHIRFSYDSNHIEEVQLKTLIDHFKITALEILEKPLHAVLELEMISETEKSNILHEWNKTELIFDPNQTLQILFEKQVQKTPKRIALSFEDQHITYEKLNQLSNQMARYLRTKGVHTNTTIALFLERGPNIVICMLAILKAGGTYVPIDPTYPKNRIYHMLEDSAATFIITESVTSSHLPLIESKETIVLSLDKEQHCIQKEAQKNLYPISSPQDLMYTIYTSGSTGKPKGVMIEHHAMLNFLHAIQQILNLTENDIWLAITPISFDISGLEIYLPLITGAQCVLANKQVIVDGKKLSDHIHAQKISILQATPMTWEMLLEAGWHNHLKMKILCGGEPLKMKLCEKLLTETDSILNLYGPTETTIWSTYFHCTKNTALSPITSIGKPIGNTQVYVLDKHLKPSPIGIIGELYIGGFGLARGYLNQPQLTSDRFIPNPFDTTQNSLLYKTGDLVSWSTNGSLDYIGRIDEQIKIRGHRVELGEIQNHIETHSSIQQAIVLLDNTNHLDYRILAFIRLYPNNVFNENDMRDYLKGFLPQHMIPQHFIAFSKLPLTPNKKVDKIKLLKLAKNRTVLRDTNKTETLETDEEKKLGKIWSSVLSIPINKIEKHNNFFDLGGHSLTALQVLAEIRRVFNLNLEVHLLFEFATLSKLANKIALWVHNDIEDSRNLKTNLDSISPCLVRLKTTGNKRPVFLIHPVGGTVFWYTALAKYFDQDRPLFGIQDPGIHSESPPFNTVSELANFYIELIRTIQPHGPYLIGGASAGSNISMEIANQLINKNQEVGFIALLDGWAYYPMSLEDREIFESLMMRQYNMMEQQFIDKGILLPEKLLHLQWHRSQMNNKYIPPRLNIELFLFKAAEILPIFKTIENPFNHWENYSTIPINCELVPGDHETIFNEPNVLVLAKKLNNLINKTGL